jgi:hypothetical protein
MESCNGTIQAYMYMRADDIVLYEKGVQFLLIVEFAMAGMYLGVFDGMVFNTTALIRGLRWRLADEHFLVQRI